MRQFRAMKYRSGKPRIERAYPPREDAGERKISTVAEVLHLDDSLIVVNKPPRVSLDLAWDDEPTVLDQLESAGRITADESPVAAYMLEPLLSGLAILARSDVTLADLHRQMAEGVLVLSCLAIVRGRAGSSEGVIDQPVGAKNRTNTLLRIDPEAGRPAVTRWQVRDTYIGAALLDCTTQPADPNQIRVHLSHVGLPLMVDAAYGGGSALLLSSFKAGYRPSGRHPERPLIDRVSMHVQRVQMRHPATGAPLTLEAGLHKDFRAALHQLDRFGRIAAL